jgi:4,5-dihydroxyphthalate decarboxylase
MTRARLSIALDRYDRHMPFFLGQVGVTESLELVPLEVGMFPPRRHGVDRHGRMLRDQEFDVAEVSLSSYIIALSRGAPFTAVPIFPRRLFSQTHIFVAERSGLEHPRDLLCKPVAALGFQVTMSVVAKGDLRRDYGIDWRDLKWLTLWKEEIATPGLPITQLPPGTDPARLLLDGTAAALIHPHPPHEALSGRDGIRRLFLDTPSECERHFGRHGYLPIMHLLAIKTEVARRYPELPVQLMQMWNQAKAIAADYYHDPGFGLPALSRLTYERQQAVLGADVWTSGLAANRLNLTHFLDDMLDQGLISRPVSPEELFHSSVLAT